MSETIELSAVVPVVRLYDRSGRLIRDYIHMLESAGRSFELVYVLDGEARDILGQLGELAATDPRVRVVQLAKSFGEASALTAGFSSTTGDVVLTLPAYDQVDISGIPAVLDELRRCDLAVATRNATDRSASWFKRARRSAFHWLIRVATGQSFSDLGCGVRAMKREVANELPLYGDQYRFLALLATRRGFKVNEVPVDEPASGVMHDRHGIRDYLARLLDIFAVVFLTRFTKMPLRFFGTIGSLVFAVGALFLLFLVVQRLFFGEELADRPALLLSSLMVVLGLQVFALGLLGELIIFTHARSLKEYTIERIVN